MGQLKYNIKLRLSKLPRTEHELTMKKLLEVISPVSRSTFYRWMNTKQQDNFQIPYTAQVKIAGLFGCTVDDLAQSG